MDSEINVEINNKNVNTSAEIEKDNNISILMKRQYDDFEANEDEAQPNNALCVDNPMQMAKEDAHVTSESSTKTKKKTKKAVINSLEEKQAEQIRLNRDQVRDLYRNFENSAIELAEE